MFISSEFIIFMKRESHRLTRSGCNDGEDKNDLEGILIRVEWDRRIEASNNVRYIVHRHAHAQAGGKKKVIVEKRIQRKKGWRGEDDD